MPVTFMLGMLTATALICMGGVLWDRIYAAILRGRVIAGNLEAQRGNLEHQAAITAAISKAYLTAPPVPKIDRETDRGLN